MRDLDIFKSYIKSPYKSIKHNTYFECYEHFFSKYRGKKITFVEIGVLGGGSLFMWRDYFGKNARIIGIDLNKDCLKWEKYGFEIYIGDQSDEFFWEKFKNNVGGIDLVLDDGGHTYEQQIITVENLLNSINDKGMILVEDTHTSYMYGFGPKKYSFINYVKNKIDKINHRFNKLSYSQSEKNIWSIEIVESMVAFKINKKATNLKSRITDNGGIDDNSRDARYDKITLLNSVIDKISKSNFSNFIPIKIKKFVLNLLRTIIIKYKFKARRFFN